MWRRTLIPKIESGAFSTSIIQQLEERSLKAKFSRKNLEHYDRKSSIVLFCDFSEIEDRGY